MKAWKLELQALSPVLIGDRQTDTQFNESMDQIPGNRLRAALARTILDQCPYFDPVRQPQDRRYYVEYQGGESCRGCHWAAWCEGFADMRIGFATPQGAHPFPLTAMGCKFERDKHPLVDTLIMRSAWQKRLRDGVTAQWQRPLFRCQACGERLENLSGWYDPRCLQAVQRPPKHSWTRLQIDPVRGTAAQGQLYTILPMAAGTTFAGPITAPAPPDGQLELRVGARTSSGLGHCAATLTSSHSLPEANLTERVLRFNRILRRQFAAVGLPDSPGTYISLTLVTPAAMEPGAPAVPSALTTPESLAALRAALALDRALPGWEIAHAFTGYQLRGGWRLLDGNWAAPRNLLIGGSVLVLLHPSSDVGGLTHALATASHSGIGQQTEDGLGRVEICAQYHMERSVC